MGRKNKNGCQLPVLVVLLYILCVRKVKTLFTAVAGPENLVRRRHYIIGSAPRQKNKRPRSKCAIGAENVRFD